MRIRNFLLCCFLCFTPSIIFSQLRWDSLGKRINRIENFGPRVVSVDSNYLYMAGDFVEIGGKHTKGIARWNGIKWDSMGAGINGLDTMNPHPVNGVWAMASYYNKLYVTGTFSSLGNLPLAGFGVWNGSAWDSIAIQPTCGGGALTVIGNKLYMGGFDSLTFTGHPSIFGIACWNDTNWSGVNFPANLAYFNGIETICEYNGNIYAGGAFNATYNNDTVNNILCWDGKNWHSVGEGGSINGFILSMTVYQGELYVAGYFSGVDNNIQRWDGTQWHTVGGGTNYEIFNLMVYNNKLYAMGELSMAGGIPASSIAEWDGSKWCSLGSTFDNTIGTACVYKDSLYIGGGFWTIDHDSISYIAEWTGGNYTANCSQPTGVNQLKINNEELKVYPNPSNGIFTLAFSHPELVSGTQTIEVYNVLGQQVYQSGIVSNSAEINLSGQPQGIYLYRIITQEGSLIGEGKVVVQR